MTDHCCWVLVLVSNMPFQRLLRFLSVMSVVGERNQALDTKPAFERTRACTRICSWCARRCSYRRPEVLRSFSYEHSSVAGIARCEGWQSFSECKWNEAASIFPRFPGKHHWEERIIIKTDIQHLLMFPTKFEPQMKTKTPDHDKGKVCLILN